MEAPGIYIYIPGTPRPTIYKWLAINWMAVGNGWKSPNIYFKLVVWGSRYRYIQYICGVGLFLFSYFLHVIVGTLVRNPLVLQNCCVPNYKVKSSRALIEDEQTVNALRHIATNHGKVKPFSVGPY